MKTSRNDARGGRIVRLFALPTVCRLRWKAAKGFIRESAFRPLSLTVVAALGLAAFTPELACSEAIVSPRTHGSAQSSPDITSKAPEPMQFEDLLGLEAIDQVWYSPQGDQIVFSTARPIKSNPSFGFEDAESRVRQRVYIRSPHGGPIEIQPPAGVLLAMPKVNPWLRDGSSAILLATDLAGRRTSLASYSPSDRSLKIHSSSVVSSWPRFAQYKGWLVYIAFSPGALQSYSDTAKSIEGRWLQSWLGGDAQVTVRSNVPLFENSVVSTKASLIAFDPVKSAYVDLGEGAYTELAASPDGRLLAAAGQDDQRQGFVDIFAANRNGIGRISRIATQSQAILQMEWSPSGQKILVVGESTDSNAVSATELSVQDASIRNLPVPGDLWVADVFSGQEVMTRAGWIGNTAVAIVKKHSDQDGHQFSLHTLDTPSRNLGGGHLGSIRSFVASTDGKSALVVANGALWRATLAGEVERLTATSLEVKSILNRGGNDEALNAARHNAERVALQVRNGDHYDDAIFDIPTRRVLLSSRSDGVRAVSVTTTSVVEERDRGWPSTLYLRTGKHREVVASLNASLEGKAIGSIKGFSYQFDGKKYPGWAVFPPGCPCGKRLPAVMFVYGGEVWDEVPIFALPRGAHEAPVFSGQALAANGYVVLYPSLPFSNDAEVGFPERFHAAATFALDAVIEKGWVDGTRVGLMGQSFGGYTVAAIMSADPGRFRAGIAMAGVYDLIHAHANPSMVQLFSGDGRSVEFSWALFERAYSMSAPPWIDPLMYMRNSPYFRVARIRAPLLLIHGDLDLGATSPFGAVRMYEAIRRSGGQVALALYSGEGHVAKSEANMRDQWHKILSWLSTYVAGSTDAASRK